MVEFESRQQTPDREQSATERAHAPADAARRTAGGRLTVQARLAVGADDDPAEREADAVAATVLRNIDAAGRVSSGGVDGSDAGEGDAEGTGGRIRRTTVVPASQPSPARRIRRMPATIGAEGGEVDRGTESAIAASRGSGSPLADDVRRSMESGFSADFSRVRIHTDARSDSLARGMQATAFTTGSDIFFSEGAYQPGSRSGQELLAHELTHVVQQSGPGAAPASRRIQRRIGFEIETGIPLTKRVHDHHGDHFGDIVPSDVGKDLPIPRGQLSPDHIPGTPAHQDTDLEQFDEWPIIELVTDPIDDTLTMDAFSVIATSWITSLRQIKALAQATPPAANLLGDYYVGLPSAQPYGSWDRIAPQVTVGVPLDQVPKILAGFDETQGMYRAQLATQIGQQAGSVAAKVMQDLFDRHPPGTDGKGVAAVKGLLTMIVNHLMVGGNEEISRQVYMKNRPANVMYKTKLSTVRNNIVANPYANTVLGSADGRAFLKARLIAATHRNAGDRVFVAYAQGHPSRHTDPSDDTVDDWLDQVLGGVDDGIFEDMRNEWSAEIAPDDENEVVIELRRIGAFVSHDDYSLETGGLLRFLQKVYGTHQLYKQRKL